LLLHVLAVIRIFLVLAGPKQRKGRDAEREAGSGPMYVPPDAPVAGASALPRMHLPVVRRIANKQTNKQPNTKQSGQTHGRR
jgi:hypothetical protein